MPDAPLRWEAFVPEDKWGKARTPVHLCNLQTWETKCGLAVGRDWVSRPQARDIKGERRCKRCGYA